MSVTLRNAIINAYAHAYVHSIDVLYLLPRDFFYLAGGHCQYMSERKRQLARLRKQRQRSCMNLDVQRQEARRHQQASRAAENEQRRWYYIICLNETLNQVIARQACLKMWSLNILNHLLCSFSAALEACWWRLASCRWTSGFMQLLCRCLRSLASCLFRSDILSSGQVLQITYNYQSSLINHCSLI